MKVLSIDKKYKSESGIGVLEALISIMVITTAVAAVIIIIFGNQSLKLDNEVNNIALYRASQIIEKSKILGAKNFNSVVASTSVDSIFTENLSVTDMSPCRKDIKGTINWSVQSARPQNVFLTTSLVSIDEAAALGNDCIVSPPETPWRNPQTYNGADLYPGGNAGTGIDYFTVDGSKYVVMTSVHSASSSHDFWIYDVTGLKKTDVMSPRSSLNTGYGLYALDVAKNKTTGRFFAYVVGDVGPADGKQLKVIDLFNVNNPTVVAEEILPGVGNSFPQGREVYFYNDRLYIGTWETAGDEFHVYDVSNPYSPQHLGSAQINHSIRDIVVRNELINGVQKTVAYLALSVTSASQNELIIIDVTDPASMVQRGAYNAPGIQYGTALYLLGNKLYLGRGYGSANELYLLDISNHSSVGVLGSARLDLGPSVAEVNSILVSNELIFLGTSDSNQEFQVWNIANQANMFWWSQFNFPAGVMDMEFDGKFIYTAVNSNDGLRILYDSP